MFETIAQDLRHAVRVLTRGPVFALTAILSLAIGVGATSAIFSLVNSLILSPAPGIQEPERVVSIGRSTNGNGFDTFSYPVYQEYRDNNRTLDGVAAMQFEPVNLSVAGPEGGIAIQGSIVTGNFFDVLGARPAIGRFFAPDEDRVPRAHPVVVLSHRFWHEHFSGDSSIAGRAMTLNGTPFTVVGVAAERFHGPVALAPDVWVPVMSAPLVGGSEGTLTSRPAAWLLGVGRLKPGVGISEAQADLAVIARQAQQAYPDVNENHGVRVAPSTLFPGDFQTMVSAFMTFLMALSGLVLLVAGTNVAGMLLARAAARRREIAVRLAIGASRSRLVQSLLVESTLIFVVAGLAGIVVARWLLSALMAIVPRLPVSLAIEPRIDWTVLGFAMAVSVVAGMLAGLVPALQSTRPSLAPELRSDVAGSGSRLRLRSVLLVAQMAFSMLLLVTGGLFARALVEARAIDPGFDPRNVQVTTLDFQLARYDSVSGREAARLLLERTRALPGVNAVALSRVLPLDGGGLGLGRIDVPGREAPDPERGWEADWNVVTPAYFDVLRIPVVRGRGFTDQDRAGAADVAIINESLAERIWPGEDAVGKTFTNEDLTVTVVGVARNSRYRSLGEAPRGFVYVPFAQRYMGGMSVLTRAGTGGPGAAAIRQVVAELNPALPILDQKTLEEQSALGLFPQRMALSVAGSLGVVALLLAVLGIYGVTAYGVARRMREIGIRVALGSPRNRVVALVLRQGLTLAAMGVTLGLVASLGVTRLLESMLFGVSGRDVVALGGAAGALVLAAAAASWLPARRAARVDPVSALRSE